MISDLSEMSSGPTSPLGDVLGFTAQEVADRTRNATRPVGRSAVTEVQRGARRVDVDDLVTLTVALDTGPVDLLTPPPAASEIPLGQRRPAPLYRMTRSTRPNARGGQTHLKPSSYRPLEIAWRVHVEPASADHRLGDVTHTEVQSWVSKLSETRRATTVQPALAVLSGILDESVRDRCTRWRAKPGPRLPSCW
jgi:hypothetical protein